MVLSGHDAPGGHTGWNQGRALLIEVDEKLAAAPQARFMVRALLSVEDADKNNLRQAGKLSRRDVKRPGADVDFAQLLALVRTVVTRDTGALARSGAPVARPAVVFFAEEPPLADAITAEVYQDLARQASVIWVMPADSVSLLSLGFATAAAAIVTQHLTAAGDVLDLLRLNAGIVPAQGGAASAIS
jgi:hypothetical protein